ncbi:MAG: DNA translocase FtsK [Myxococcales bacterium]
MRRRGNRKLKKGAKPTSLRPRGRGETAQHLAGIAFVGAALFASLALGSFGREAGNLAGPVGQRLARAWLGRFGLGAFLAPLGLLCGSSQLLEVLHWSRRGALRALEVAGAALSALLLAALLFPSSAVLGAPLLGSAGAALVAPLLGSLATAGAALAVAALGWGFLSLSTDHAVSRAAGAVLRFCGRGLLRAWNFATGVALGVWREQLESWSQWKEEGGEEAGGRTDDALDPAALDEAVAEEASKRSQILARKRGEMSDPAWARSSDVQIDESPSPAPEIAHRGKGYRSEPEVLTIGEDGRIRDRKQKAAAEPIALVPEMELGAGRQRLPPPAPADALLADSPADGERLETEAALEPVPPPSIIEPTALAAPKRKKREKGNAFRLQKTGAGFSLPTLELLEVPPDIREEIDREALTETAHKLTAKLADFGIKGRVATIRPGPVITMYEFEPAPGIRVSKIQSLSDDLAMAMEALQVRIVAPIPGKSVVGIEVPNRKRAKVYLREILEEDAFQKMTSPLTLAFGKDTEGAPYLGDLSRMPHLLVAGTTGSGKSVSMNSMIMSLLFKASPEDVRMIMIDPKMVELSMYEGIPHLLLPVVQDAQKAPLALRWAVEEMERRYHLIGKLKVKDLKAYNEKVPRLEAGEKLEDEGPKGPPKRVVVVDVGNGETEEEALARLEAQGAPPSLPELPGESASPNELEKLPYIVIIIDELADLMMVASREVEQCIARLAAKARAAGIHIVIATQRPSTDVISGVIKSNLPVRIAFRLASRHDSATIINGPGAERLLGEGDMLHIPPGGSDALRLHGALVRESEIERVVEFWKGQATPVYDEEILRPRADEREGDGADGVPDELYDQAIAVVSQLERVSISLLQRKMGVGYNRAADLIERMERDRVIGPANGVKPREVLVKGLGEMTA